MGGESRSRTAKAQGDDVWAVQARKDRLLDRWSIIVARFNASALQCAVTRSDASHASGPPAPPARVDMPDDRSDAGTERGDAASDDGSPLDDVNAFLASTTRDHDDGVDYVDAMTA